MKNDFVLKDDCATIYCNNKKYAVIIDREDFLKVSSCLTWGVTIKKGRIENVACHGKQQNKIRKPMIRLHRLVMNCRVGEQIDHINGNVLDNRKKNLRLTNNRDNGMNRKLCSKNKSGHRNIYLEKDGKYRVRIMTKKHIYSNFGRYKTLKEAIEKRDNIYKKYNIRYYIGEV